MGGVKYFPLLCIKRVIFEITLQLLHLLDFDLIKANLKVFCSFSGITALSKLGRSLVYVSADR